MSFPVLLNRRTAWLVLLLQLLVIGLAQGVGGMHRHWTPALEPSVAVDGAARHGLGGMHGRGCAHELSRVSTVELAEGDEAGHEPQGHMCMFCLALATPTVWTLGRHLPPRPLGPVPVPINEVVHCTDVERPLAARSPPARKTA